MEEAKPKKKRDPVIKWTIIICGTMVLPLAGFWIWHAVLSWRVEQRVEALGKKGYPTTFAELARLQPNVPEEENAGPIYLAAIAKYAGNFAELPSAEYGAENLPIYRARLSEELKATGNGFLRDNAEALSLLHSAAAKPQCKYPDDPVTHSAMNVSCLAKLRQGATLLRLEALIAAEDGREKEAADSIIACIHLANSVAEGQLLPFQMKLTITSIAWRSTEDVLNRITLSDESLAAISNEFGASENGRPLQPVLEWYLPTIIHFGEEGEIFIPQPPQNHLVMRRISKISGMLNIEKARLLDRMQNFMETSEMPTEQWQDLLQQCRTHEIEKRAMRSKMYMVSRMVLPVVERAFTEEALSFARIRTVRTALAIERYRLKRGAIPEDLRSLVPEFMPSIPADPLDGNSLRYKKTEKGYLVYSVDVDGMDDGGLSAVASARSLLYRPTDRSDLVFVVERTEK